MSPLQGVPPLEPGPPARPPAARGDVAEAARQFEGLLIANLLKTGLGGEGGGLFGQGPGAEVMDGMLETFLSEHIARAGGLGISGALTRALGGEVDR